VIVAAHDRAELRLGVAVVVAITGGATGGDAVGGALAVDRILVLLAPLAADAAVAVQRIRGAELGRCVAVMVAVAGGEHGGGAVDRALAVDRVLVFGAEVARDAFVLVAIDVGAELGVGVAVVVLVTARAELGNAVLRALAVDGVLRVPAVVARHALVLVGRLGGAELGSGVAVFVGVAVGSERRDAVCRAVFIH
jgi:hypothetical protein